MWNENKQEIKTNVTRRVRHCQMMHQNEEKQLKMLLDIANENKPYYTESGCSLHFISEDTPETRGSPRGSIYCVLEILLRRSIFFRSLTNIIIVHNKTEVNVQLIHIHIYKICSLSL